MQSFRGHPEWDWRTNDLNRMCFKTADAEGTDVVKRRALTVLRAYCTPGAPEGTAELDGPLWALVDASHGSEECLPVVPGSSCLW